MPATMTVEPPSRSPRNVTVRIKGAVFNSSYEVKGDRVVLISAYGSISTKAGKDPKAQTETLLAEAVEQWWT